MKINSALLMLSIIFFCSCSRHNLSKELVEVQNLLETNKDSALKVLHTMTPFLSDNELDQAYFSLLLVEARGAKKNTFVENDSLLDVALRGFGSYKNKEFEIRSLINKGRVWANVNQDEEALKYYYKALNLLGVNSQNKLLPKIHEDLGYIYINQQLYSNAFEEFNKSYILDSISDDKKNMILSLCNLSVMQIYLEQPHKSLEYIHKAYSIARQMTDSLEQEGYIDYVYGIYLNQMEDYEKALKYISKSLIHYKEPAYSRYLIKGGIFIKLRRYDSAYHYLSKGLLSDDLYTRTSVYYDLFLLNKAQDSPYKAIEYLLNYCEGVDSISINTVKSNSQTLFHKFNVERAVFEVTSKNRIRMLVVVLIFSIFFLVVCIYIILRRKKTKLEQKENEQLILLNEKEILTKEKEITNLHFKIDAIQKTISQLRDSEESLAYYKDTIVRKKEELFALMGKDIYRQSNIFKKTRIFKQIHKLSEQERDKNIRILTYIEQEELKNELFSSFSHFTKELQESFPALNESDIIICCLSVFGYSSNIISLCFTVSGPNAIKQRRHRIKSKMSETIQGSMMFEFIFMNRK